MAGTDYTQESSSDDAINLLEIAYLDRLWRTLFRDNLDGTFTLVTADGGPAWRSKFGITTPPNGSAVVNSADMSTAAALTDMPPTGYIVVIDDVFFSTDTAMNFIFQEETSTTQLLKGFFPASNGIQQATPRGKVKTYQPGKRVFGKASVSGNVSITLTYHFELPPTV